MECPNCGSSEHVVPIWESKMAFLVGAEPKYIGCTECREMEKYGNIRKNRT